MKIKGVYADKKRKGEPIEYTPLEKVPVAVRLAAANFDENFAIHVKDVKVGPLRSSPKGDPLKKKFQHNVYFAEGEGIFTYRRRTDDTLLEPKKKTFKIEFCDCLDNNGMPELTIDRFELA